MGWHKSLESRAHAMLIAIRILAGIACAISIYLAITSMQGGSLAGCDGGMLDCDHVINSKWSTWLGLPVAGAAVLIYAGILVFTWNLHERWQRWFFLSLTTIAGLSAVWFTGLQVFVLKSICPYCMVVHGCGLLVSLIGFQVSAISARRKNHSPLGYSLLTAIILMAAVITGQVIYQPDGFEVTEYAQVDDVPDQDDSDSTEPDGNQTDGSQQPDSNNETDTSSNEEQNDPKQDTDSTENQVESETGETDASSTGDGTNANEKTVAESNTENDNTTDPVKPEVTNPETNANEAVTASDATAENEETKSARRVGIFGGIVFLSFDEYPYIGDVEADHAIVKMFDYTCPDCRRLHGQLEEYQEARDDTMAILLVVVPMNSDCNPHIRRTTAKHVRACDYTRLALAVWHADKEKFPEFHQFLMKGEFPPTVHEATKFAGELVEDSNIKSKMYSAAVGQMLRGNTTLYRQSQTGIVPKLFIKNKQIAGGGQNNVRFFDAIDQILADDK